MSRTRALVARQGRKTHFATLGPGETAWLPVCDVAPIPVFGATEIAREDWHAWTVAAEADRDRLLAGEKPVLCSRCRTPLLVAALAVREHRSARIDALEIEGRRLRAELARWTTAALAETKRTAAFAREHVVFKRAAR